MPIDIDIALNEGEDVGFGTNKKVDKDELVNMLSEKAWTIAELADHFNVKKQTIRQYLYKLRKDEGYNLQSKRVDGVTYYFIVNE